MLGQRKDEAMEHFLDLGTYWRRICTEELVGVSEDPENVSDKEIKK